MKLPNLIGWFLSLFGHKEHEPAQSPKYELVEQPLDENHFRQGIKITEGKYQDLIATIDPKVKIEELPSGYLSIKFDYLVESNKNGVIINEQELREFLGAIIVDLINKDYNEV